MLLENKSPPLSARSAPREKEPYQPTPFRGKNMKKGENVIDDLGKRAGK
jgi:hypothetical protein